MFTPRFSIRALPPLSLAAMVLLSGCSPSQPVAKKEKAPPVAKVKTVAVAETEWERTTRQPASVHAYYQTPIHARATGFVDDLKVDIGDRVSQGDTLAVIAVPEMEKRHAVIEARIAQMQAEEERAAAGVRLADAQVRASQAMRAEAKAQLDQVEASVAAAQAEFDRTQDLVDRQSLQPRMLDEARKKLDSEQAQRQAVRSSIDSAAADVSVAEAGREAAQAARTAAEAETEIARRELAELQVLIEYATVQAPFAGKITQREVEPGDLVQGAQGTASSQPLFVLSQVEKVRIRVPVPEADAPLIRPGDGLSLTFPSFAEEAPLSGTITRIAGSLDPETRTMMVEADMPNPEGKLLPGMFGEATIQLGAKVATGTLPARAIRFAESGEPYVYRLLDDQTVAITEITTGLDNGNTIEVRSGLEPGQRVIDAHLQRFRDGEKVALLDG